MAVAATGNTFRSRLKSTSVDPNLLRHIRSLGLGFRRGSRDRRAGQNGLAVTTAKKVPRWRRPKQVACAALPEDFPSSDAEVAFAGRSNVGKSSLLNALSLRMCGSALNAGVSARPGETTSVNFYSVRTDAERGADGGGAVATASAAKRRETTPLLVDLPGRGFAFGTTDKVEQWVATTETYLRSREALRAVYLLLDARHGIKPLDRELLALLSAAAVPVSLVMTKCDLVQPRVLAKVCGLVAEEVRASAFSDIVEDTEWGAPLLVSSKAGAGLDDLSASIAKWGG